VFKTKQKQADKYKKNKKGFWITLGDHLIPVLPSRHHYWPLSGLLSSNELCKDPVFSNSSLAYFLTPPQSYSPSFCFSCRLHTTNYDSQAFFFPLQSLELTFLYALHSSQERERSSPSSTNSVKTHASQQSTTHKYTRHSVRVIEQITACLKELPM